MKAALARITSRAKYAAIGAAIGAGIGGLVSRNAASTGAAVGALVGATLGEQRAHARGVLAELRDRQGEVVPRRSGD